MSEVLKNAGAEKADLFVAVNPSTSQNVNVVCSALAKSLGSKKVVCRVNNEEYLAYDNKYLFSDMGIDLLFYPEKIAAGEIVDLLKRSASTEAMEFGRGKLQISVYKLEEDSPIIDKTLLDFSRDFADAETRFRVVAIARGNETIIPKIDTRFRYHDLVFIISRRDGAPIDPKEFPLGRRLRILPNHACSTGAAFDRYHAVENGTEVIGVYPRINYWEA